ncbi:MAG: hypothetical protein IAE77_22595 [Prosthecobacter sp.]|uniref:hypothetical protein n=1 Tax=Prosthecobacter sp. TaxID=1965333 RepID=UPI001A0A2B45|nr:hypothetical protein [Prosthecobacter sp.]MBE2286262.1 hypothetical protein [Prosthecobacter sp.]
MLWRIGLVDQPRAWLDSPLDPQGREAFLEFGKLNDAQVEQAISLYEAEAASRGFDSIFKAPNADRLWLAEPAWTAPIRLLCTTWQLEQEGHANVRVGMITSLLAELNLTLSNPSMLVRYHAQRTPPAIELLDASVGRSGLLFRLTAAGKKEALAYRDAALAQSPPKTP